VLTVEYLISCTHPQHDVFVAVDPFDTQRVSRMYRPNRIRNTVDSPSGDPEIELELANGTAETTGGRGATLFVLCYRNCPKDDKFRYFILILRKLGAA